MEQATRTVSYHNQYNEYHKLVSTLGVNFIRQMKNTFPSVRASEVVDLSIVNSLSEKYNTNQPYSIIRAKRMTLLYSKIVALGTTAKRSSKILKELNMTTVPFDTYEIVSCLEDVQSIRAWNFRQFVQNLVSQNILEWFYSIILYSHEYQLLRTLINTSSIAEAQRMLSLNDKQTHQLLFSLVDVFMTAMKGYPVDQLLHKI